MGGYPSKEEREHNDFMEQKRLEFKREEVMHRERMEAMALAYKAIETYSTSVSTAEVYTRDGDLYKGIPALKYALGEERTLAVIKQYSERSDKILRNDRKIK